jgi:hypothetical protein
MTKGFFENNDHMPKRPSEQCEKLEKWSQESPREMLDVEQRMIQRTESVNEEKILEGDRYVDENESEANNDFEKLEDGDVVSDYELKEEENCGEAPISDDMEEDDISKDLRERKLHRNEKQGKQQERYFSALMTPLAEH